MVASGIRVFMPDVPGVGIMRQRYPIMPDHVEGSGIDKNLAALQVSKNEPFTHRDALLRLNANREDTDQTALRAV